MIQLRMVEPMAPILSMIRPPYLSPRLPLMNWADPVCRKHGARAIVPVMMASSPRSSRRLLTTQPQFWRPV